MEDGEEAEIFPFQASRVDMLGFMASLCALTNNVKSANDYLLELLSWAAFGTGLDRPRAQA
jgi:hypothetical protein